MQQILNDIIVGNLFAFLLIFMRLGMALMIMPGIGDSFTSPQIRLSFALAFSFVLTPLLASSLPHMPIPMGDMLMLLLSEAFIGIFIGTIMRILITALDTAGMMISMQAGFANAMIFNPVTATQGSLVGGLYSMLGITLLLATNIHHFLFAAVVESYQMFPAKSVMPDAGGMSDIIARAVATAFRIGIQIALPFIVVGLLIQGGFGLLGRLMPQVQIFFLAMPVQIALSLVMITMVLSAGMLFWISAYQEHVRLFLGL